MGGLGLTPQQAQGLLSVSASTLRRWAVDFATELSELAQPKHGRKRKYSNDDIGKLQRVRELYAQGYKTEKVKQLLAVVDSESTALEVVTLPDTLAQVGQLTELVKALALELREGKSEREALSLELREGKSEREALRSVVDTLELRDVEKGELITVLEVEREAMRAELEASQKEVERLATNDAEERDALRKLILWRSRWESRPWWARILGLEPPRIDDE